LLYSYILDKLSASPTWS